jgi:RNA polymerase sigma-70 factor (ECF subfamily)
MDPDAFERQLDQHRDSVYRQMVRVCGNYDDADDALAEAMLLAFRASATLRDPENFRAWLAIIGRRVCVRLRQHPSIKPILEMAEIDVTPDDAPNPEQVALMNETKDCIHGVIAALPADLRELYVMREIEQRPGQEVADQLGLSLAAMKSRLHRAREMVRNQMDRAVCM